MKERVAAIDCGTNSIRLLVADVSDGVAEELVRGMRIVRLGQDVDATGRLAPQAIERTLAATREYAEIIASLHADRVRFCATSAARDASNAEEFAAAVEAIVGVRLEILTGIEEAKASFVGATGGLASEGDVLVVDIGGGSTELVVGRDAVVAWSTSLDVGAVRMTERFLSTDPPTAGEIDECRSYLREALAAEASGLAPVATLVGVAGTITTVAAHAMNLPAYDRSAIHGMQLSIDQTRAACASLASMTVDERRALPFMHPGRADVIGGGALVLDAVLTSLPLATDALIVSEHDILDGIALA
ncbi:MAG TPA: Ppx/GppA phosphatase family protein [Aeromicrobium sp.]|nr:Ppx/GppA phosphatase family protein [Aeromicrobium sp.]